MFVDTNRVLTPHHIHDDVDTDKTMLPVTRSTMARPFGFRARDHPQP